MLTGYLDWPEAQQVFRVERERTCGGKTTREVAYGITSLPREKADAAALLRLCRGHWRIENGLHYVRDVTFGEDPCRVRCGAAPQVLAAIRNVLISLLNQQQEPNKAAALRRNAAHPLQAYRLLATTAEN
jgi:predicted transposase YbfD/YdcC